MYTSEQRVRALRMYHQTESVTETVHLLGYPSRECLYTWIRSEGKTRPEPPSDELETLRRQIYEIQTEVEILKAAVKELKNLRRCPEESEERMAR